jgi:hypothetical protein
MKRVTEGKLFYVRLRNTECCVAIGGRPNKGLSF